MRHELVGLVFCEGMRLTLTGVVLGLFAALGAGRAVNALLFGVAPADVTTLALTAALFVVTAALALLLPTWRAAAGDSAQVLREQ